MRAVLETNPRFSRVLISSPKWSGSASRLVQKKSGCYENLRKPNDGLAVKIARRGRDDEHSHRTLRLPLRRRISRAGFAAAPANTSPSRLRCDGWRAAFAVRLLTQSASAPAWNRPEHDAG